MPDRIVYPTETTAEQIEATIGAGAFRRLADLADTTLEGVATALTRWRSELCGAADVLPHIEAERDRLKAEVAAALSIHQPCHDAAERALLASGDSTGMLGTCPCTTCCSEWPCATARALGGTS